MKILITGGTGLIGRYLISHLQELNHKITVVTRDIVRAKRILGYNVELYHGLDNYKNLDGFDAVINFAGEPIANKKWTEKQKFCICNSRWTITQQLVNMFNDSKNPPSIFISGSAIGYYGNLGELIITENNLPHNEFIHKLCSRWEQIAYSVQNNNIRVCLLRTGIVLSKNGGFLEKILKLFKLGFGFFIGNGKQYMSWIHINDMINAILWLLNNDIAGPLNMVSPYPVNNERFIRTLCKVMNIHLILNIPAFLIRMLVGELSVLMLNSQRVIPKRLQTSGFEFSWYNLKDTLCDIVL